MMGPPPGCPWSRGHNLMGWFPEEVIGSMTHILCEQNNKAMKAYWPTVRTAESLTIQEPGDRGQREHRVLLIRSGEGNTAPSWFLPGSPKSHSNFETIIRKIPAKGQSLNSLTVLPKTIKVTKNEESLRLSQPREP